MPRGIAAVCACLVWTMLVEAADIDPLVSPAEATRTIRALLKKGKTDPAHSLAQRARERFPKDAAVQAALGDACFRLAEFDAAEAAYRRALGLDAKCARAHYGMGRLHEARSEWESAREAYEHAYALDSDDLDILRSWAVGRREASEEIAGLDRYLDLGITEDRWLRESAWSRLEWRRMVGNRDTFVSAGAPAACDIKLGRVEAPFSGSHRTLVATLATGKQVRLILDSSLSGVMLKPGVAKRKGLKLASTGRRGDDATFGGWAQTDTIQIGPLEFRSCPIRVKDHNVPSGADGTISTDVFRMFLIRLDPSNSQLTLLPLPSTPQARKRNAHSASWSEEDAHADAVAGPAVRFLNAGGGLLVRVQAAGRISGYFLFEPRLGANVLTNRLVDSLRLSTQDTSYSNSSIYSYYRTFGQLHLCPGVLLRFGAVERIESPMYSHDGALEEQRVGVRIAGHLGMSRRGGFTATLNYRDAWIDFQFAR